MCIKHIPERRKPSQGMLMATVRVTQPTADNTGIRVRLQEYHGIVNSPGRHDGIAVEEKKVLSFGNRDGLVIGFGKTEILCINHELTLRKTGFDLHQTVIF